MPRPTVSVVMATYQRAHLLARSLTAYYHHSFDNKELELVVIDDHSTDNTREMVLEWSRCSGIKVAVVTPAPKLEAWRDCGAILNTGIRASSGRHIILTHPEVIPGKKSVSNCVDMLEEFEQSRGRTVTQYGTEPMGLYACCRVYYLSPREQGLLDAVDWKARGNLAVRDIPEFYEADTNGHPDFCHRMTDSIGKPGCRVKEWGSWVFGGCSRETWKRMGGMLETQKWGSVDVAFMHRRRTLGITNYTCNDDQTIVIHQNHNCDGDVETPRVEDAWKRELKEVDLDNPNKLRHPAIDYLGW